ncbi:riboflavin synthase [bacterium]|nr:riboflavin synthase [bacterium]
MFTGLIEEVGKIRDSRYSSKGCVLCVECGKILDGLKTGDSVAVNGACLTVTKISKDGFETEISNETLSKTNSNSIKIGAEVNLEPALQFNGRLDGHIVTGHIDCYARFKEMTEDGFSKKFTFEIEQGFQKYLAYKGSVAINGISLTVADKDDLEFSVVIIPSTIENTNIRNLKSGDVVNIETDILAKYVENFVNYTETKKEIDKNFLEENGFI